MSLGMWASGLHRLSWQRQPFWGEELWNPLLLEDTSWSEFWDWIHPLRGRGWRVVRAGPAPWQAEAESRPGRCSRALVRPGSASSRLPWHRAASHLSELVSQMDSAIAQSKVRSLGGEGKAPHAVGGCGAGGRHWPGLGAEEGSGARLWVFEPQEAVANSPGFPVVRTALPSESLGRLGPRRQWGFRAGCLLCSDS